MCDQLVFIARREQRAQQQHVGNARADRIERGIAGVHDDHVRADLVPDYPLDDGRLAQVGFDRENNRHQLLNKKIVSTVPTVANTRSGAFSRL